MTRKRLAQVVTLLALLLIWEVLAQLEVVPSYVLPSPIAVAQYLMGALQDYTLISAIFVTLKRLLIGYVMALLLGVPLGLLCARSRVISGTVGILAISAQSLPSVCWVPFALLALGQSEWAMLFVVIMGSIGSIVLSAEASIRKVPRLYIEAARTMSSRGLHRMLYVLVPAALPEFLSGIRQGWAFAWRSLMAAEIYVSVLSGLGLGQLLHFGRELHAMEQVLGVMTVILVIGLIVERAIFSPIQSHLHRVRGIA